MNMSERIKEQRIRLGLTQEELGLKLGLQKSAIAKYENGRVENIKRSVIAKMAEVLECSPSYLMGWCDNLSGLESTNSANANQPPILSQVKTKYGKNAATALSLYVQLDEIDQVRITERMTVLLEDEKYTSKLKNGASLA